MPQMYPMNWWLLSLFPFLMISMNMIFMQFILTFKKMEKETTKHKIKVMDWKW